MIERISFQVPARGRAISLGLMVLGAAAAAFGLYSDPKRTWPSLLLNGFYFAALALISVFFLASQRLAGSRWSASLRRIPEALMSAMPAAAILVLVLFFGRNDLFPWADHDKVFHDAPAIAGKVQYLQMPYVFARLALAVVLWCIFAWLFRKLSRDQNPSANMEYHRRLNMFAPIFVIIFAISFTLFVYDFIISLDPRWFSTMFGVYLFAGTFVNGICAVTFAVVLLREQGLLRNWVSEDQLHDLGKMVFAFSTFWAYIWTCQYLLIWYSNIPEEVSHYTTRTIGPWLPLFVVNFLVNWILPFTVLMSAANKRKPKVLLFVTSVLFVGHWLDLYMQIMPSYWSSPKFGPVELLVPLGYAGLFYFMFVNSLAQAPLVPVNDPILAANLLQQHAH